MAYGESSVFWGISTSFNPFLGMEASWGSDVRSAGTTNKLGDFEQIGLLFSTSVCSPKEEIQISLAESLQSDPEFLRFRTLPGFAAVSRLPKFSGL